MSCLDPDREQFVKFSGALQVVTSTRAGRDCRGCWAPTVGSATLYTAARSHSADCPEALW